jgi:hypothetical protein
MYLRGKKRELGEGRQVRHLLSPIAGQCSIVCCGSVL